MRIRAALVGAAFAAAGMLTVAPAHASCVEPGDPVCTARDIGNATICSARAVRANGTDIEQTQGDISNCFTTLH
ncbi:MAG: hypothetical protein M3273_06300 [Actinomycetota bacterium]|nr:hypothetical protein [Actinomycetota bacterium]